MDMFKGVFREEGWAMPLLSLSVITLCVLLLYTVFCFCSWIKPSFRRSTLLPWLQMPFLIGLMCLTSTAIVSAVPLNDASCRVLFIGPGISYVLVAAGLLSRIIQHTIRAHIVLHWLLIFFVVLNQIVISVAYVVRSTKKTCELLVHDQLLMMLYPALLVGVLLLLVYRTARRTSSALKSREAIHVGLATSFGGAFAGCWLGAACVLGDALLPSCLGFGCLATVVVVSIISLIPRQEELDSNCDTIPLAAKKDARSEKRNINSKDVEKVVEFKTPTRVPEKPNKQEPTEIIIVPITSDGHVLPDIALQAIKARGAHFHRHYQHEERKSRDKEIDRLNHQQLSQRPHRWHNKLQTGKPLRADSRKIKTIRSRSKPGNHLPRNTSTKPQRTPYNHRGWLY